MKTLLSSLLLSFTLSGLAQDSLNITMLFNWDDPSLPANGFFGNQYNEVWGFVQGGREYAVIGSTDGTHIFDVTDPVNSVMVDMIPGAQMGSMVVHRDYYDYNGYLFAVCDEGASTLQVIDLSGLPASTNTVYDSNVLIRTSHNIVLDTNAMRLYACGVVDGTPASTDLRILDVSSPTAPTLIADWNGIDYYHDIFVYNDTAIGNNGFSGLSIVDFTNASSPNVISTLTTYPFQGYNHSGYTTEDRQYYVMSDENHGYDMKMIDITDVTTPSVVTTFNSGVDPGSIPHNQIIMGNYLFVAYYHDGLYIYDISNPSSPVVTGYYDTSIMPHNNDYVGAWGVYPFLPSGIVLVSDMQNGLYVLDISAAVGMNESALRESFNVYPNPFTNELYIETLSSFETNLEFLLTDISGKLVTQGAVSPITLDVSPIKMNAELNPGIYFLTIRNDRYLHTIKVVKK